ncbi:hypothetical protein K0M31_016959 [Melipona bicolor]|uniref:Uncharacterized protein n=1 Tax=Melipona bicolor TaxID=60889 RepID=A0AA40FDS9_9HYME|nr:hypothetical protein K0M31_016959 [Melipona bicolor]
MVMRRVGAAVDGEKAAEKCPSTSSRTISGITSDNTYARLSILPSNLYTLRLVSRQLREQGRREDTKRRLSEKMDVGHFFETTMESSLVLIGNQTQQYDVARECLFFEGRRRWPDRNRWPTHNPCSRTGQLITPSSTQLSQVGARSVSTIHRDVVLQFATIL